MPQLPPVDTSTFTEPPIVTPIPTEPHQPPVVTPFSTVAPPTATPPPPPTVPRQPLTVLPTSMLQPLVPTTSVQTTVGGVNNSPAFLLRMRATSCSRANFAANLNRSWFSTEERISSNVRGKNGKPPLSPRRIQYIHDAIMDLFPPTQTETPQKVWTECVKAIDVANR